MYKLVAFDAYGTLFNVYSISNLIDKLYPGFGQDISTMWRDRQIEYTRLVTMSNPNPGGSKYYLPFWEITFLSLRYVFKRMGLNLTAENELLLMGQYSKLQAFDDSLSTLKLIQAEGIPTAILSNGSKKMLSTLVVANQLSAYLTKILTVEDIRLFKTAPEAYQLILDAFKVKKEEVLFVSSNAWDVIGARWFGFDVFWVNRQGHPYEEIGEMPTYIGSSLSEVLNFLGPSKA